MTVLAVSRQRTIITVTFNVDDVIILIIVNTLLNVIAVPVNPVFMSLGVSA